MHTKIRYGAEPIMRLLLPTSNKMRPHQTAIVERKASFLFRFVHDVCAQANWCSNQCCAPVLCQTVDTPVQIRCHCSGVRNFGLEVSSRVVMQRAVEECSQIQHSGSQPAQACYKQPDSRICNRSCRCSKPWSCRDCLRFAWSYQTRS